MNRPPGCPLFDDRRRPGRCIRCSSDTPTKPAHANRRGATATARRARNAARASPSPGRGHPSERGHRDSGATPEDAVSAGPLHLRPGPFAPVLQPPREGSHGRGRHQDRGERDRVLLGAESAEVEQRDGRSRPHPSYPVRSRTRPAHCIPSKVAPAPAKLRRPTSGVALTCRSTTRPCSPGAPAGRRRPPAVPPARRRWDGLGVDRVNGSRT